MTADDVVVDVAVRQAVYGIVAEAVRNAVRHADASSCEITLARVGRRARRHGGRRRRRASRSSWSAASACCRCVNGPTESAPTLNVSSAESGHARRAPRPRSGERRTGAADDEPVHPTCVVVDDHPVFRLGMVALLTSIDGFDVVGEAATADEAGRRRRVGTSRRDRDGPQPRHRLRHRRHPPDPRSAARPSASSR